MQDYSVQRFRGGFAIVWRDPASSQRRRYTLQSTDRQSAEAEARRWWATATRSSGRVGDIVEAYLDQREAEA